MNTNSATKKKARLENWNMVRHPRDGTWCLIGKVKDHAVVGDDKIVLTSDVVHMDLVTNKAETIYTMYDLGKFSQDHCQAKYDEATKFWQQYKRTKQ